MTRWVSGSCAWSIHYVDKLRRRGNTLHVFSSRLFLLQPEEVCGCLKGELTSKALEPFPASTGKTKSRLMKCEVTIDMLLLMLLLVMAFPYSSH